MNYFKRIFCISVFLTSTTFFAQTIKVIDKKGTIKEVDNSKWTNSGNAIYNKNSGNVGIGTTTPDASAKLEVSTITGGFLPPRLTTPERDAIVSPAVGLVIFNITTNALEINSGTAVTPIWNSSFTPDATSISKGILRLSGDLAGTGSTAAIPIISNNAITTGKIADAAVTTSKIASGGNNKVLVTDNSGVVAWIDGAAFGAIADMTSIEGAGTTASPFKVKDLGIVTAKLADAAVTTIKIADSNITNAKLANDAITTGKIVDGTIIVDDLANNAVETSKIKDANVTTSKLADAVVTTTKIASGGNNKVLVTDNSGVVAWIDGAAFGAIADMTSIEGTGTTTSPFKVKDLGIVTAKLADNAVTSAKIENGTILVDDLSNNAVETLKIKDLNVTEAKLADAAVTSAKILDGTIVTTDLGDNSVATNKIIDASVTTTKIADTNVTTAKLADNAVTSAKILNGTVVNEDIADATITTAKIAGTIAIAQGGTGSTTAGGALTNLGAEAVANKSTAIDMDGTNADNVKYPTQLAVKTFVEISLNNGVGSATQTALNLKEDVSNKSTNVSLGTSDQLYPSQNAVKSYVDTKLTTTNAISSLTYLPNISNNRILGNTTGATTTPQEIPVTGSGDVVLKTSAEIITPTITSPVLNGTISGTAIVPVAQGGSGANMSTTSGYVKQASIGANFTTVSKIPLNDVDGAVHKVNGTGPDATGNVTIAFGTVTTGNLTARPAIGTTTNGDIYVVSGDTTASNDGRTFISDGTNWNEVTPNQASLDARYLRLSGDTMDGDITVPAGNKITLTDAPSSANDAANKGYVDAQITNATPNATTLATGKVQLAGDLTGTATAPEIGTNKVTFSKMQTVSSNVILGRATSGTGNIEALTTLPVATLPALTGDVTTNAGSAATTITDNAVTLAKIQNLSAQNKLLGTPSTGGLGVSEITLGTGLSMSGGTLNATGGTVTNVTGTTDRITVTNGATTPTVDISANYVGQNSITTLGTITTGTWNGTTISVPNGGTGTTTLTGYVIGNGTSAMTASATIPVADVTGAQTMANLSANITTNTGSTTMYPNVAAVETYVTAKATPDATTSVKGKIRLAGDLGGTADAPTVLKIQGTAVSTTAPTTNQLLQYDGTEWKPVSKIEVVTMETEEFTPTAGQTAFSLANTPLGKVGMFINGVRVPKEAITISGTSVTYDPSKNGSYDILVIDRVSFDYIY